MITITNKLVDGVNVEFKHYNDRAGTVLFRIKDGKRISGWEQFVSDELVVKAIHRLDDKSGFRRLL